MTTQDRPARTFKTAPTLLWWAKGQDNRARQRAIAKLIERPIESRVFTELPTPTLSVTPEDSVCWIGRREKSNSAKGWELATERAGIILKGEPRNPTPDLKPHFLFVPRLTFYSVEAAYEQAKVEADPQFSPHGAFRQISTGDKWAAIDFINEFGPLELLNEMQPRQPLRQEDLLDLGKEEPAPDEEEPAPKARCVWVDVDDFWRKHQRFVAVAKLWEARESRKAMVLALSELAGLRVYPSFGALRAGERYSLATAVPWGNGTFSEWLYRRPNENQVRDGSAEIIKTELSLWAHEMKVQWTCSDACRLDFRIVPSAKSLWSAIWHLFARDTSEGLGWRVCPHCSKLFYPKRKDSYFCESKYQKLFAANRWWQEHQEDELAKRHEASKSGAKRKPAKNAARKGK